MLLQEWNILKIVIIIRIFGDVEGAESGLGTYDVVSQLRKYTSRIVDSSKRLLQEFRMVKQNYLLTDYVAESSKLLVGSFDE